jgi:hypothetical protein
MISAKKLVVGVVFYILLWFIYSNLPPLITNIEGLYFIISLLFVVLLLLGGLYVFR